MRNYQQMLQAARNLRVEREKEQSLGQQKLDQKNQASFWFANFVVWCLGGCIKFIHLCYLGAGGTNKLGLTYSLL